MERPWAATDFTCHNKELMQSNKQGKKKKKGKKKKQTSFPRLLTSQGILIIIYGPRNWV